MEAAHSTLGHEQAIDLFPLLIDEELTKPDEEALVDHLDDCAACKQSLEQYARTVSMVRSVGREKAPVDFVQQVMRRVRRRRRAGLFGFQGGRMFEHLNIPGETAVIAVLLAAVVAAAVIFAMP